MLEGRVGTKESKTGLAGEAAIGDGDWKDEKAKQDEEPVSTQS
jgi:hypothetical protein